MPNWSDPAASPQQAGNTVKLTRVATAMTLEFGVTWDYRCPFARNAHEHLLTGLAAEADWHVQFLPFSLGQVHVAEGEPSVWDKPEQDTGILALQAGVIVRDEFPDRFPAVHRALFAARHDDALHVEDHDVVRGVLLKHDVDDVAVFSRIESGDALNRVRAEHERYAESHNVWGVPTFVAGDQSAFVRLMSRAKPGSDPASSITAIERTVDLLTGWPDLNEFKHTSIPR